jgi:hypothetical protein
MLLWGGTPSAAQEQDEILTIASSYYNIHPQIACNSVSGTFLVTLLQTEDLFKFDKTRVYGVLIRAPHKAVVKDKIRISRASSKKRQAPFTAVAYHPQLNRFLILWKEIDPEGNTLFLTSLDDAGELIQRSVILDRNQGTLISGPFLALQPESGRALAVWTEVTQAGAATTALSFDPNDPRFLLDPRFNLDAGQTRFYIPKSLLSAGNEFKLFSYYFNTNLQRMVEIDALDISSISGPVGGFRVLTSKKTRRSLLLSAAPTSVEGESLILYNRTNGGLDYSVLSLVRDVVAAKASDPIRLTTREVLAWEGVVLPPAADGLHRLVWAEDTEAAHYLKVQQVDAYGDLYGEPQVVRASQMRIRTPAASYSPDCRKILVVWSEDFEDGSIRVLGRYLELQ